MPAAPGSGKHRRRVCGCGCNRQVTRWTELRHKKRPLREHPESPSPPKRHHTAQSQAGQESSIIRPGKQKQPRADKNFSVSHSRADTSSSSSGHPPSPVPSFEFNPSLEFSPSLPSLDPAPASNLLQLPGAAHTEASGLFIDNICLNIHAGTHRTTNQSDDEDSGDAFEGDAVEAADSVDHESDDFWNGEDVGMEGDVDPREGVVSDWDLLAEEFIVKAEELGKFEHSLSDTPWLTAFFVFRRVFYLGP